MFSNVLSALIIVTLVGCAAQILSPEQRQQQTQALREYTIRLSQIGPGSTRADIQSLVGTAMLRSIFREDAADVEEWSYPTDSGYETLRFSNDKLVGQKTFRTALRFARDTSIPLTQSEIQVRLLLSSIKVGASKTEVSRLTVKPTAMLTAWQTGQLMRNFSAVVDQVRGSPLFMGIDPRDMIVAVHGETWIYEGARLSVALLFADQQVARIVFSEKPSKAQQNEMMQRAL